MLKISRKKLVVNRLELLKIADLIRNNPDASMVSELRLNYQFFNPQRQNDGQIVVDSQDHVVNLPRILFAAECMNYKEMQKRVRYNGLVVVEVNGLKTYEEAVSIRNLVARMDETVMTFLGASGKSVKIICRGELFSMDDGRGKKDDG